MCYSVQNYEHVVTASSSAVTAPSGGSILHRMATAHPGVQTPDALSSMEAWLEAWRSGSRYVGPRSGHGGPDPTFPSWSFFFSWLFLSLVCILLNLSWSCCILISWICWVMKIQMSMHCLIRYRALHLASPNSDMFMLGRFLTKIFWNIGTCRYLRSLVEAGM
jgi:hypothetical protein